ncbi:hypothetical protein KDC22_32435 [Paenibacillus tritici]|uniref:hypothetical protein n=1 Tax=Paenibacillus tritici TaxID=1873425 RepID=UPI001BAE2756|nr:hypothetical protein [Paenibacillus tritici]QUL54890.1 hypothetical protein KDC22_32435 [Paenibacillus tritici]
MDRLKNSGFYKLQFFITPEEFRGVLKLLEPATARFYQTNYARTEHDQDQVVEAYRSYYHYYIAAEQRDGVHPSFVYSISVLPDQEQSGYFTRNEQIYFPYYGQWAEDKLPSILFSLPKGVQVDLEDERGKYYIYEDIRDRRPLTYTYFSEISGSIRTLTKPLRFSALEAAAMDEQKPSVRISPGAAQDLSNSWIFSKYGLRLQGKLGGTVNAQSVVKKDTNP